MSTADGDESLAGQARHALSGDGPFARQLAGFELRSAQVIMAGAVADVLDRGGVLMAEAGTGTGKTLAYLVPAVLSGRRVLVSTGTKNLQEQIYFKDVPAVRHALGVPFTATYMKGRGNYLCLHRFEQFKEGARQRHDVDDLHLLLVEEWARTTATGDRAEIEGVPEELGWWGDISAASEHCLGSTCPRYDDCHVTTMRQRAAASDIVIVNHHLLCADAAVRKSSFGEVIPECHAAIVDEAHQLEDVATQYFGVSVSNHRLEHLVRDAEHVLHASPIDPIHGADARIALGAATDAGRTFFADIRLQLQGTGERLQGSAGLFDERVRLSSETLSAVLESGLALIEAVGGTEQAFAAMAAGSEDLAQIARRAQGLVTDLQFVLAATDPAFVYFLEVRHRGVFLKAAPIDVGDIVRELLLDRMQATVLTSATLAIGGSFSYMRGRLGIGECTEVQLPSEFDYSRQAILYLPRSMPDPRAPTFGAAASREIEAILDRTRGRAFVLFTSYATLRDVEARLRDSVPFPLLVQGKAPRSVLLDEFRRSGNGVLLATSSFWQGVDVVGEALSCVIIDKLPFASPGEPITAARIGSINERGGNAFESYQVPLAILSLLQGLGRLLRHRLDRGVLAILDPRLTTRGYGRRFLEALPPAPVTRRLEDLDAFFTDVES